MYKMYSGEVLVLVGVLIVYLLLVLFVVVDLSLVVKGPLRVVYDKEEKLIGWGF